MNLQNAVNNLSDQLTEIIRQLTPLQYSAPCRSLSENTIGQHVRHIIELFQELEKGYDDNIVNYDSRKRDKALETDQAFALERLRSIAGRIDRPNKDLLLHAHYDDNPSHPPFSLSSNYFREIAFNIEHTIHHMALIRVGLIEVSDIELPEDFGVAASTLKHRKQCVQ